MKNKTSKPTWCCCGEKNSIAHCVPLQLDGHPSLVTLCGIHLPYDDSEDPCWVREGDAKTNNRGLVRHCKTCVKRLQARELQQQAEQIKTKLPPEKNHPFTNEQDKTLKEATILIEYLEQQLQQARDVIGILHASIERYDIEQQRRGHSGKFASDRTMALDFLFPQEKGEVKVSTEPFEKFEYPSPCDYLVIPATKFCDKSSKAKQTGSAIAKNLSQRVARVTRVR